MPEKSIVIVDIDGTITIVGDRLKYLKENPVDWDSFYDSCFEDDVNKNVLKLVEHLVNCYRIVFCTGRRESVRNKTDRWINKHFGAYFKETGYALMMRKNGDFRHDTIIKPELLSDNGINQNHVSFILEDRNSMVAKWRELGYTCLQVADGDF